LAKSPGIETRSRPLGSTCRCCASDGRLDLVDNVMRARARYGRVGHGELAGSAQQQALAELGFQRRHAAGHGRLGEAQPLGRAAEAALVHHPREEEKVVGLESQVRLLVHGIIPFEQQCYPF
jgi:hypothetical protein